MSIPICILDSNNSGIISNKSVQYYQNIGKILMKKRNSPNKNNKDLKQYDFESLITLPSVENSKNIFNWFSNLSLKERVMICSIHNKWLSNLINQLIIIYNYDQYCTLSPIGEFNDFFEEFEIKINNVVINRRHLSNYNHIGNLENDKNFFTYFLKYESAFKDKSKSEYKINQHFLNNLKFFNYEEPNDTILISKYFLSDVKEFKRYFDYYTGSNFLKSFITPDFNDEKKLYNFKFPSWLCSKPNFNIFELIVGYFEQNILLNYEYYDITKKIYDNKLIERINEIDELNIKLEKFLSEEYKEEKSLFSQLNLVELKQNVQKDSSLEKETHYQRYLNSKIFGIVNLIDYKIMDSITDNMVKESKDKMKEYYNKSISHFLYNISFVNSEDVISYNRPFYAYTFNYITGLFQSKNAYELIKDLDNNSNKKKKHKKKKKKNTGNKDENINNIINIIKDEKEVNIIEKKINENEINNDDIEENNEKKNKKQKNKKQKEFFLYPTQQNKKKKEENKENENNNDKNIIKENIITSNSSQNNSSTEKNKDNNTINPIININNNKYNYSYIPIYTAQIFPFYLLNNIYLFNPTDNFFSKLSSEIEIYNTNVINNNLKLEPIKKKFLEKLDKIIKDNLIQTYNIDLINFGSFTTNLSIEGSDIDILIKYKPIKNKNTFVSDLISILYQNNKEFDDIKAITTASVPIIKLQFDIKQFMNIKYIEDYLDYDDLYKLKFDITFKESDLYNNNVNKTIDFVNKSIIDFPSIKEIVLLMKRYFKKIKLNKSYLGGLSSYSLFLMVLAFLKLKNYSKDFSIGKQFYDFIEWYSFFNFSEYYINVNELNPFIKINELNKNDKIIIIDPINQSNVAKSSFKLEEIKNAFIKVLNIIKIDAWEIEQQIEIEINNISPLKILSSIFNIK